MESRLAATEPPPTAPNYFGYVLDYTRLIAGAPSKRWIFNREFESLRLCITYRGQRKRDSGNWIDRLIGAGKRVKENRGEMRTPRSVLCPGSNDGPPIGPCNQSFNSYRTRKRIIQRCCVLCEKVQRRIRQPLSIQNSCTRSVYARVRRAPDRAGEHAEGGRSKKQEEERRGKRKGERSARSRGSTYM